MDHLFALYLKWSIMNFRYLIIFPNNFFHLFTFCEKSLYSLRLYTSSSKHILTIKRWKSLVIFKMLYPIISFICCLIVFFGISFLFLLFLYVLCLRLCILNLCKMCCVFWKPLFGLIILIVKIIFLNALIDVEFGTYYLLVVL